MPRRGKEFPDPPILQLRHGAVWQVVLEAAKKTGVKQSWAEGWAKEPEHRQHLVVVSQPFGPRDRPGIFWLRSRLIVGDLEKRPVDDIMADFRKLLLQTPPVQRNWEYTLARVHYKGYARHIVWDKEITCLNF